MTQQLAPNPSRPVVQLIQGLVTIMQQPDLAWDEIMHGVREVLSAWPSPALPQSSSPQERALQLVAASIEELDTDRALELVLDALRLDPDCIPAYLLLGNNAAATFPELGLFLLTLAVVQGQEQLGTEFFEAHAGDFGSLPEAAPFLDALQGLATVCWEMGDLETAAKHFATMLDLDAVDTFGARLGLLPILLEAGMVQGAGQLLESFPEDESLLWKYGRLLHEFQVNGPGARADELLREAKRAGPDVVEYLGGQRPLEQPSSSEAEHSAALMLIDAWQNTPGAAEFVSAPAPVEATAPVKAPAPIEPAAPATAAPPSTPPTTTKTSTLIEPPPGPSAAPAKEKRSGPRSID